MGKKKKKMALLGKKASPFLGEQPAMRRTWPVPFLNISPRYRLICLSRKIRSGVLRCTCSCTHKMSVGLVSFRAGEVSFVLSAGLLTTIGPRRTARHAARDWSLQEHLAMCGWADGEASFICLCSLPPCMGGGSWHCSQI
jgi:hypothetical protein